MFSFKRMLKEKPNKNLALSLHLSFLLSGPSSRVALNSLVHSWCPSAGFLVFTTSVLKIICWSLQHPPVFIISPVEHHASSASTRPEPLLHPGTLCPSGFPIISPSSSSCGNFVPLPAFLLCCIVCGFERPWNLSVSREKKQQLFLRGFGSCVLFRLGGTLLHFVLFLS